MIVRIVRGRLAPERLDDARAALSGAGLLPAGPRPGVIRSHVGARQLGADLEVVALDYFATPEDAAATEGAGPPTAPAVLTPLLHGIEAAHFEVDDMVLRATTEDPCAIRVSVGRFSQPGLDAEMQERLRERVASLGPEMAESYVARRMVGRAVEVALVSTWLVEPPGLSLDRPFWPDMVSRYDHFLLAVYAPLDRAPRRPV